MTAPDTPTETHWAALAAVVGQAIETAPDTRAALDSMLDICETRPTAALLADAADWCDRITTHGYIAAGPWTGWLQEAE